MIGKKTILLLAALLLLAACAPAGEAEPFFESTAATAAATTTEDTGSFEYQYSLGMRYLSEGNYTEAVLAFTAAIDIDPRQPKAYIGRGDALVLSSETADDLDTALADYQQALRLDDMAAEAYLGLADIYIRRGDLAAAEDILKAGLDKTGDGRIADRLTELRGDSVVDSQGTVRVRRYYDPEGNLEFYTHYLGEQEDGTSRLNEFDAGGVLTGYSLSYASADGLTHYSDMFDADGSLRGRSIRVTDTAGKWVYSASLNEAGNETNRHVALYDDSGTALGWDSYDENGQLTSYVRYEGGRTVYYNADGTVSRYAE